ncbi:MAG: triose-phosphate isomerase [Clostridia bacterium]|nr:triose-phosphate isomerase [Clostridia bacterium]
MRKKVIAGNWKMNKNPEESKNYLQEIIPLVKDVTSEVILCVPYIDLKCMVKHAKGSNIKIGAQNMHWEESGAYTGEVSGSMLKSIGVEYVIIGHSERRQYFAETDETVNKKIKAAFANELKPIVCVGESLEQREKGKTKEVITTQTRLALEGLTNEQVENTIIAYEPIWAIGTGKTATSEDANNSIKEIRDEICKIYGQMVAERVIIQYGGSVKPSNAKELFSTSDIDGALVGGASLKPEDFAAIVNY